VVVASEVEALVEVEVVEAEDLVVEVSEVEVTEVAHLLLDLALQVLTLSVELGLIEQHQDLLVEIIIMDITMVDTIAGIIDLIIIALGIHAIIGGGETLMVDGTIHLYILVVVSYYSYYYSS
jgi:hypothetical protein